MHIYIVLMNNYNNNNNNNNFNNFNNYKYIQKHKMTIML